MLRLFGLLISLLLFCTACKTACDDILTVFNTEITDTSGRAVFVDSTVSLRADGRIIYHYTRDTAQTDTFSQYKILDNGDLNKSQEITFKAFRKDSLLVRENYFVNTDDCGVKEVLGNRDIVVPKGLRQSHQFL